MALTWRLRGICNHMSVRFGSCKCFWCLSFGDSAFQRFGYSYISKNGLTLATPSAQHMGIMSLEYHAPKWGADCVVASLACTHACISQYFRGLRSSLLLLSRQHRPEISLQRINYDQFWLNVCSKCSSTSNTSHSVSDETAKKNAARTRTSTSGYRSIQALIRQLHSDCVNDFRN